MNRQRLILFILLILLILALAWSYIRWPRQKTVADLKYSPGKQAAKADITRPMPGAPLVRDDGRVLRLDLLNRATPVFSGYRRNIFKPLFVDELKMMKQQASAVKPALPPVSTEKLPSLPPVVQQPALAETPQRELTKFTFLGFLKKDNRKTIFLAKDKDIILVKKGDAFAGRYEALSVTEQALTILVTDTGEEIVIPLVENRPLTAAAK